MCVGQRDRLLTRANLFLPGAVLASLGLGLAAVYVPALRDLLHTEPLFGWELLPAAGALLLGAALGRITRPGGRIRSATGQDRSTAGRLSAGPLE